MKIKSVPLGGLVAELRHEAEAAQATGRLDKAAPLWSLAKRLEKCAVHVEDDDSAGIEREKAMVKAFEAIAASVEGIRVEMAKARGQRNMLPPFDSGGGMRVKT